MTPIRVDPENCFDKSIQSCATTNPPLTTRSRTDVSHLLSVLIHIIGAWARNCSLYFHCKLYSFAL